MSPGQTNSVTVTLQGSRPNPGSYEGFIVITGAGPTLRVPYLYFVGTAPLQPPNASVTVSPSSVALSPGQTNSVTVALQGNRPNPGSYEGFIAVTGAGPTLRVPYLYFVGDLRAL